MLGNHEVRADEMNDVRAHGGEWLERGGGSDDRLEQTISYYDAHAVAYADETRLLHLEDHLRTFVGRLAAGSSVLDLGCGAGRDLLALARAGLSPTGLDLSASLAAIAESYSGRKVVVGDIRYPPFPAGSFEGVWAAASLLHLERSDIVATLLEVRRILRPGGLLLSTLKRGTGQSMDPGGRWFTYHEPADWHAALAAAGFRDIVIQVESACETDKRSGTRWFMAMASSPE